MFNKVFALVSVFLLLGCATGKQYVFTTPSLSVDFTAPSEDMAQVVFLRPSKGIMGVFNAIIVDVTSDQRRVIGVAPAESKFVVNMTPGKHRLFSTQGLQGHVMALDVEAGQRYFVLVRPIYGNGFQLRPIKRMTDNEFGQNNAKFPSWLVETAMVDKAPGSDAWYADFIEKNNEILADAEEVWAGKSEEQRAELTLLSDDAEI